jgi:hypothetical protein
LDPDVPGQIDSGDVDGGPAFGLARLLGNLSRHLRPYRGQLWVLFLLLLLDAGLSPCMLLTLQRGHFLELIDRVPDLLPALERVAERRAAAEAEELDRAPMSRGPLRRAFDSPPSSRASFEHQGLISSANPSRRGDVDQVPASRIFRPS